MYPEVFNDADVKNALFHLTEHIRKKKKTKIDFYLLAFAGMDSGLPWVHWTNDKYKLIHVLTS